MCGITGIFHFENDPLNLTLLRRMTAVLTHRGPDDEGYVLFGGHSPHLVPVEISNGEELERIQGSDSPVHGLGHRRLSIIDLSPAGHQPMANEDGSVWLAYNGEVYNYLELRRELQGQGHSFHSRTDTEVVVHGYEEWGTDCLNHFNGMWAFALWDNRKKVLFCARDRFGIKPFYYHLDDKRMVFASEIKSLLQDPSITRIPNEALIHDYLRYGYVDHTDETFFDGIHQLRGGHYLVVDFSGRKVKKPVPIRYWDIDPSSKHQTSGARTPAREFLELFEDSIRLRLRSDVPLGTCLSGGLDSSSIVCLASRLMNRHMQRTFSSCFEDEDYDERRYIREVLSMTKADGSLIFPDPQSLFQEIQNLLWFQEEPFYSTSVYAQWNVFRLAEAKGVKVVLDGQGADEILGGYHSALGYHLSDKILSKDFYPEVKGIRRELGYSYKWIAKSLFISLVPFRWIEWARRLLFSRYREINLKGGDLSRILPCKKFGTDHFQNFLYHMVMAISLPALLHYEDRNSMAFSIESRVPFLDHRVVEFLFSVPSEWKTHRGVTKRILRESMDGVLPEKVRSRPDKLGFVTPEAVWFRTVLKGKIEEILESESLKDRGYFNLPDVRKKLDDHCSGRKNMSDTIWRWVNLELWLRSFIDDFEGAHEKSPDRHL